MTLPIPETPDAVTSEWLTDALRVSGVLAAEQRVSKVDRQHLGEGEGFLGDILRLTPTYTTPDPALPSTLIAKLPKLANRAMGELLGAYERENMFYMELAESLPLATPKMYYGDFDRDKASEKQEQILRAANRMPRWLNNSMMGLARRIAAGKKRRYILLLEDIRAEPGDQLKGASVERTASVLVSIAKAHAMFWNRSLADRFWLLPLNIDSRIRHSMYRNSQQNFREVFASVIEAGLGRFADAVVDQGAAMMDELCTAPHTLLHCDLRLDNVFFRDEEVVIFDWQLVRHGPVAYDIAYLLSGALTVDVALSDLEALLASYHAELERGGVADYAFERLKRDFALGLHTVLFSLASIDQVDLGGGRGVELIRSWIQRLHARLEQTHAWL